MEFALTIIASDLPLNTAHLAGVMCYLDGQGIAMTRDPIWLKPHKAADLYLSQRPNSLQMRALRDLLNAARADVLASPARGRKKKLLLADMDATIIEGETLDALAGFTGKQAETAAITALAMRGELDFKSSLRERVGLLKGLPESVLQDTLDGMALSPGAAMLVGGMREKGAVCVLVSGGFDFFTKAAAKMAGFHHHHGNVLEIADGTLAGTVAEPILDREAKAAFLQDYMTKLNLQPAEILAIGDGANDLSMLELAGLGIGYHPKPLLLERLDNVIIHGDLTAALYAQGLAPKGAVI